VQLFPVSAPARGARAKATTLVVGRQGALLQSGPRPVRVSECDHATCVCLPESGAGAQAVARSGPIRATTARHHTENGTFVSDIVSDIAAGQSVSGRSTAPQDPGGVLNWFGEFENAGASDETGVRVDSVSLRAGLAPTRQDSLDHTRRLGDRFRARDSSRLPFRCCAGLDSDYFGGTAMGMLWQALGRPHGQQTGESKGHPPVHAHAASSIQMHAASGAVPGPDGQRAARD
jgi:hypothetical protein